MLNQEHDQFLRWRDEQLRAALREFIASWEDLEGVVDLGSPAARRIAAAVAEAREILGK